MALNAGRGFMIAGVIGLAAMSGMAQVPEASKAGPPDKSEAAKEAPPAVKGPGSPEMKKLKAEAARRAFEQARAFYVERQPGAWLDGTYLWSVRLLHAELDLADGPQAREAAHKTHLESMTSLDRLLRRTARFGMTNQFDLSAVEFYKIEAEQWLESDRAK